MNVKNLSPEELLTNAIKTPMVAEYLKEINIKEKVVDISDILKEKITEVADAIIDYINLELEIV